MGHRRFVARSPDAHKRETYSDDPQPPILGSLSLAEPKRDWFTLRRGARRASMLVAEVKVRPIGMGVDERLVIMRMCVTG